MCFCDEHIKRKGVKYDKNKAIPCPKCGYETSQTKDLSMSTRSHKFGRQQLDYDDDYGDYDDEEEGAGGGYYYGGASGGRGDSSDEDDDYSEGDDDDEEDESDDSDEPTPSESKPETSKK